MVGEWELFLYQIIIDRLPVVYCYWSEAPYTWKLYRDGELIYTGQALSFHDPDVTWDTTYTYTIYGNPGGVYQLFDTEITATPTEPRTLYWVGNGGNWNDPTHWSLESGGTGGEPIPLVDYTIFDSSSFNTTNQKVKIYGRPNEPFFGNDTSGCLSMDWSTVTNNPTLEFDSNICELTFTEGDYNFYDSNGYMWRQSWPSYPTIVGNRLSLTGTEYIYNDEMNEYILSTLSMGTTDFEISLDIESNVTITDETTWYIIDSNEWKVIITRNDALYGGLSVITCPSSGGSLMLGSAVIFTGLDPILENVNENWKITRTGNDFKLFRNNIQQGSTQISTLSIPDTTAYFQIGQGVNGYIDNVYIKNETMKGKSYFMVAGDIILSPEMEVDFVDVVVDDTEYLLAMVGGMPDVNITHYGISNTHFTTCGKYLPTITSVVFPGTGFYLEDDLHGEGLKIFSAFDSQGHDIDVVATMFSNMLPGSIIDIGGSTITTNFLLLMERSEDYQIDPDSNFLADIIIERKSNVDVKVPAGVGVMTYGVQTFESVTINDPSTVFIASDAPGGKGPDQDSYLYTNHFYSNGVSPSEPNYISGMVDPWRLYCSSGTISLTNTSLNNSEAYGGAEFNAYTINGCVDNEDNVGWYFRPINTLYLEDDLTCYNLIVTERIDTQGHSINTVGFSIIPSRPTTIDIGSSNISTYFLEVDDEEGYIKESSDLLADITITIGDWTVPVRQGA